MDNLNFLLYESNNNNNNNIENNDSMSRYTYVRYVINLLLTSIAWSLRENIRPRSFMYGLSRPRSDVFP